MSTRSDIIVERTDGSFARIYCHYDGYLEGVGATLQLAYNSQARAEELVKEGDLSILDNDCTKPFGHSFDSRKEGFCVYYGRDRGETGTKPKVKPTLATAWPGKDTWTEFTYVWSREAACWFVGDPDRGAQSLVPLAAALAGENAPTPFIKAFGMTFGRHAAPTPKTA